ncbi:MAG: hypothetical protein IKS07_10035 [Lachnospiraceae bacterium]|nr:hypothetical protein [Lachnospiraceae bacterium]
MKSNDLKSIKGDELYRDELQSSVRALKEEADRALAEAAEQGPDIRDVVRDVILFFVTVAGCFAWLLLMLLIISFVSLGYLHFELRWMILASAVFALIAAGWYLYRMVHKYQGAFRRRK